MTSGDIRPTCFIITPITTHEAQRVLYNDQNHWINVMDHFVVPAVEDAGFDAVRPIAKGSAMILPRIIEKLATADMVLCDLSSGNVNVGFELGVRTALNLPVTIIIDEHTAPPFDVRNMNAHFYNSSDLNGDGANEKLRLTAHIRAAVDECGDTNPMWQDFGVGIAARNPATGWDPTAARVVQIAEEVRGLRRQIAASADRRGLDWTADEKRQAFGEAAALLLGTRRFYAVAEGPGEFSDVRVLNLHSEPTEQQLDQLRSEAAKFGLSVTGHWWIPNAEALNLLVEDDFYYRRTSWGEIVAGA